jgi:hypothetical protein
LNWFPLLLYFVQVAGKVVPKQFAGQSDADVKQLPEIPQSRKKTIPFYLEGKKYSVAARNKKFVLKR